MFLSTLVNIEPLIFSYRHYNILKIIIYILLYKLSLDYTYCYIISPYFAYSSMELNIIEYKYFLSCVVTIFFSFFIQYFIQDFRPSSIVVVAFYLLFFIPNCSIYGLAGLSDLFFLYTIIYFLFLSLFLIGCNKSRYKLHINEPKSLIIFVGFTILILGIFFSLLVYYNGFNIKFDLKNVYDIRLNTREMSVSPVYAYLKSFASKVVMVFLLLALIKKEIIYSAIFTIMQLMVYSFGALKSDLFGLFIVFLIYFIYNDKYRLWIIKGLIGLNVLAILEYTITNTFLIAAFIQRRVLLIPPRLSYLYYDFFSQNELLYLRDSFMRFFGLKSPYFEKASYMLGHYIDNDPNSNANTGLCGDDFSQFGWLSVILYPIFISVILKFYDVVAKNIDSRIILLLSVLYALSFISGSFFMILLTNGFILMLFYLYIYPSKVDDCNKLN